MKVFSNISTHRVSDILIAVASSLKGIGGTTSFATRQTDFANSTATVVAFGSDSSRLFEEMIPSPMKAGAAMWRNHAGESVASLSSRPIHGTAKFGGSASQLTYLSMSNRLFTFTGSFTGSWKVLSQRPHIGVPLPSVSFVNVVNGHSAAPDGGWSLRGVTSNDRYVVRTEKQNLVSNQQGLGRIEATYAALIPIRKKPSWWEMTQDERRAIFEEQSKHIHIGMKYLPPIARRLHHCRDLGEPEPFDFLTWFEYDPEHESAFEELLSELRASQEWKYVDHEVDVRLVNREV